MYIVQWNLLLLECSMKISETFQMVQVTNNSVIFTEKLSDRITVKV